MVQGVIADQNSIIQQSRLLFRVVFLEVMNIHDSNQIGGSCSAVLKLRSCKRTDRSRLRETSPHCPACASVLTFLDLIKSRNLCPERQFFISTLGSETHRVQIYFFSWSKTLWETKSLNFQSVPLPRGSTANFGEARDQSPS